MIEIFDSQTVGQIVQYFVPGIFSLLFRIYGMGAKSKRHAIIGVLLFSLIALGVPALLIPRIDYNVYKLLAFPITVIANLAIFYISSDGFLKTCFLHISQLNLVFWCAIIASSIRRMFELTYMEGNLIRIILSMAVYMVAMRYCVKPLRFIVDTIYEGWLGMIAIPACLVSASLMIAIYLGSMPAYPEALMMSVTTFVQMSFILYMRGLYRNLLESERFSKERNRHELLQAEIKFYDDALELMKRNSHDIRHHNAVLFEYLRNNDIAKAIEYLEEIGEEHELLQIEQYCQNATCNAVFRIYARKAERENISLALKVNIPSDLPIPNTELSVIISNLLENAIEACIKLLSGSRKISMEVKIEENGFCLEMKNSVSGIVEFKGDYPISTKQNGGIGTKSISAIVEKYHGFVRYRQENNIFITQIFIPDAN